MGEYKAPVEASEVRDVDGQGAGEDLSSTSGDEVGRGTREGRTGLGAPLPRKVMIVGEESRYGAGTEGLFEGFTVVSALYNEEGNLPELHRRLVAVLRDQMKTPFEIIFVDDGSRDGSWSVVEGLHRDDPHVRGIRFSRNFGQHTAMAAGLHAARGSHLVFIDCDLEEPPEAIPVLLGEMTRTKSDIAIGLRRRHAEGKGRQAMSALYARVFNWLAGVDVPPNATNLRILSRKVADSLRRCPESRKFFGGLISWTGFSVVHVEVDLAERLTGKTKYGMGRLLRHAWNGVLSFSIFPLRIAIALGILFSILSFLAGFAILALKLASPQMPIGYASLIASTLFSSGVILTCLGLVGEYVGRIYEEVKRRPEYVIDQRL